MSRSIKFRGMCEFSKKWQYGQYAYRSDNKEHYIIQDLRHIDSWEWNAEASYVKANTVSQYTGINDKNGVEIYEGDIVLHSTAYKNTYIVVFKNGGFIAKHTNVSDNRAVCPLMFDRVEVIGNIHENPELLEDK